MEDRTEEEVLCVDGLSLTLPAPLVADATTLMAALGPATEHLTPEELRRLRRLLPGRDEAQRDEAWRQLFSGANIRFGNPLATLAARLERGWYDPEVARARRLFVKARCRAARRAWRDHLARLLPEVVASRRKLVQIASQLPPGTDGNSLSLPIGRERVGLQRREVVRCFTVSAPQSILCRSNE